MQILDPYVNDPPDGLRGSFSDINDIPDNVDSISTYLKFVHREKQVNQLMELMVVLHPIAKCPKDFLESDMRIIFPTVSGTAGKGKTTFARRAYELRDSFSIPGEID